MKLAAVAVRRGRVANRRQGGFRRADHGVDLSLGSLRLGDVEFQLALQTIKKAALGIGQAPVGLADAEGHFIGQLALVPIDQNLRRGFRRHALEQHILIKPGQVGRASLLGQGGGDAAYFLAFALVLDAVREGGKQGDR
jgi:hypothetical protein